MTTAEEVGLLCRWNIWASRQVLESIRASNGEPVEALAAVQHVFATEITWLTNRGRFANGYGANPSDIRRFMEGAGFETISLSSLDSVVLGSLQESVAALRAREPELHGVVLDLPPCLERPEHSRGRDSPAVLRSCGLRDG